MKGLFHSCKSNIERMQERVPDSNYQQLQYFISESNWDADGVMMEVARKTQQSLTTFSGSQGLLLDESGWEKSGKMSVGVARQYIGNIGKVCNSQNGVFAALVKGEYVGIVNSRLYLPQEWTNSPARCKAAGVPSAQQCYLTKPELAIEMIEQLQSQISYDWIGGDAIYGNSAALRNYLISKRQSFVLDVGQELGVYLFDPNPFIPAPTAARGRNHSKQKSSIEPIALKKLSTTIEDEQWQNIFYRNSTKGNLIRQAVLRTIWLWKNTSDIAPQKFTLLISREIDKSEVKYSLCYQSDGEMDIKTALYRQMQRYWIERAFQDAKEQCGLHQYQVRSYKAWYHHVALTMMALHFMMESRIEQKEDIPLLSCSDIKLILANTLINKLNTKLGIWEAIEVRHHLRSQKPNLSGYKT